MFSKVILTIASCLLVIISGDTQSSIFKPDSVQHQEAFFARQLRQNIKVRNSAYQSPCFTQYLPQLDAINQQWALGDAYCKSNASDRYDGNMRFLEQHKAKLNTSADAIVAGINNCESMVDSAAALTCLSQLSSTQTMLLYDLSKDSASAIADFNSEVAVIKDDMYACGNATQRQYTKETNYVYQQLNYCLIYGPTVAATTSTTTRQNIPTPAPFTN